MHRPASAIPEPGRPANRAAKRYFAMHLRHRKAPSSRCNLACPQQRGILGGNANSQHPGIENREYQRVGRQAQRQRHHGNLAGHDRIIGMAQKPVRALRDKAFAGNDNNADGPAAAQSSPAPKIGPSAGRRTKRERTARPVGHRPRATAPPSTLHETRSSMAGANGRIRRRPRRQEPRLVLFRPPQLGQSLHGEIREKDCACAEDHHGSATMK